MGLFPVGPVLETTYAHPGPDGEPDESVLRRLVAMLDDVPVGSAVYGTLYSLNLTFVRDALVAANNRGCPIFVAHNGADRASPVGASLAQPSPAGLGARHRWTGRTFPDPEHRFGAIGTGRGSDLHTKLFLLEATRDPEGVLRRNVCWWGSANCSRGSGTQRFNNAVAVYDDPVLFRNFKTKLWDLIWRSEHFPANDFYDPGSGRGLFEGSDSAQVTAYCSPEQGTDLWVNRLALVDSDRTTRVHMAMHQFLDNRAVVADQLVRIAAAGALVQVAVGNAPGELGAKVRATLQAPGIELGLVNTHDKLALIEARYNGSAGRRKIVLNGSHNCTQDGNYVNDEVLVKIFNERVFDEMVTQHFDVLWSTRTAPG